MSKNKDEIKKRIQSEEDFIYCPRLGNSLKTLIDKHPDGVEDKRIAKVLLMSEEEVQSIFTSALIKIRKALRIE